MSRKERHFQGITREIRNFSENNYFPKHQIRLFIGDLLF